MATSIAVITLDLRGSAAVQGFRHAAEAMTEPLRGAVDEATGHLVRSDSTSADELRLERDRLRAELRTVEGRAAERSVAEQQLAALLEAQAIPWVGDLERSTARVIGGPRSNLSHQIEIDKGSDDGLRAGMPVLCGGGLVGRIALAGRSSAMVQLVTDPAMRVGVKLVPEGPFGTARGTGDGMRVTIDTGLEAEAQLGADLHVITSGGREARFPAGIPVGDVRGSRPADNGLTVDVIAEPEVELRRLDFVTVLLWRGDG